MWTYLNATLLAKLNWKIPTGADNICVKVVPAKYLTKANFHGINKTAKASKCANILLIIGT